MSTASLKAHYDGKQIVLDEPFELSTDARLMVTVLAPDNEVGEWTAIGRQSLARAYGNEPDYTAAALKPL